MNLTHPPSYVIKQWLLGKTPTVGTAPTTNGLWPIYTANMPDDGDKNDNVIALFDTGGMHDGRMMAGPTVEHPGIQVLVRSKDDLTAWAKISAIATLFDEQNQTDPDSTLTIAGVTYKIYAIHRMSPILPLGAVTTSKGVGTGVQASERPATEKSRAGRVVYSLSLIVTITEVNP